MEYSSWVVPESVRHLQDAAFRKLQKRHYYVSDNSTDRHEIRYIDWRTINSSH